MGWLLPLFSLAVLLLSLFWLLPTPPSLVQPPALHGVPLDVPGPIVAAATRAVDLDGLTVIPLVHLPPIKLNIPIPFYPTRRLRILFTSSASEVVFNTLRIASSSFRAIDAGRQPMAVAVSGVSADFRGSFAVKLVARVEDTAPGVEEGQKQGIQVFKWAGSGRVDAKVEESALDLQLQLVEGKEKTSPRLEVLSSSVDEGVIERAELSGFGPWGKVVTRLLPWVRGTIFVRYPTKLIVDYLAREIVEGGLVDDLLAMACSTGSIHLDIDTYGAILNDEREKEIATPLDAASLSPPSASSSSSPPPPPPSTTVDSAAPSTTPFRAHAHLIGPSLLRNFPLPDFSPPLYRPGGTRAALQSFNMLTSEVQLKLSGSSLDRITFERASIAFDPAVGSRGGELVVTVEDLTVLLKSRFSLHADTSSVISWTTGVKRIGEQGSSTTKVEARSLQLRFVLVRSSSAREGAPFVLKESSMSPFTSVEPRFQLDNQLAKLGAEVVNVVTAQLKTQIAQAASLLVAQGMRDVVRKQLQAAMDGVEEKLREAGVELPLGLRGAA